MNPRERCAVRLRLYSGRADASLWMPASEGQRLASEADLVLPLSSPPSPTQIQILRALQLFPQDLLDAGDRFVRRVLRSDPLAEDSMDPLAQSAPERPGGVVTRRMTPRSCELPVAPQTCITAAIRCWSYTLSFSRDRCDE
jgi:hypothetical protein